MAVVVKNAARAAEYARYPRLCGEAKSARASSLVAASTSSWGVRGSLSGRQGAGATELATACGGTVRLERVLRPEASETLADRTTGVCESVTILSSPPGSLSL